MLIALEGMDGVGKSTLSRLAARLLDGMPVVKAIHPLCNPDARTDNFINISDLVLSEESERLAECKFGVRGVFIYYRLSDVPMVSDRFYASNLWHVERRDVDIRRLAEVVGAPERTILLYASKDELRRRIEGRNAKDKDLEKIDQSEKAYELMRNRFASLSISFVEMSTEGRELEELAAAVAKLYGWNKRFCGRKQLWAFSCPPSGIRSFRLLQSVESVDAKAFFYLRHLSSIAVERGNRRFKSVRGVLYTRDGQSLVSYPCARERRKYWVCEGVRTIAPSAFLNARYLESIRLPDGLVEIGSTVFFNCWTLRRIYIPASVSKIGPMNFLGCRSLMDIAVSERNCIYESRNGVLYETRTDALLRYPPARSNVELCLDCRIVRAWAFAETGSLRKVELIGGVTSIEAYAFMNSGLEELMVSGGVLLHVGERAFASCRMLKRVWVLDAASGFDMHLTAFEGCGRKLKVYLPRTIFAGIWNDRRKRCIYEYLRAVIADKNEVESCGTFALRMMLDALALDWREPSNVTENIWIFDIASALIERLGAGRVVLNYFKSRFIDDFAADVLEKNFGGYQAFLRYTDLGGGLRGGICVQDAVDSFSGEDVFLLLVDDAVLHGDVGTGNGHYIVVKEVRDGYALIFNPRKKTCIEEIVSVDVLVDSCEALGGWILIAKHETR